MSDEQGNVEIGDSVEVRMPKLGRRDEMDQSLDFEWVSALVCGVSHNKIAVTLTGQNRIEIRRHSTNWKKAK